MPKIDTLRAEVKNLYESNSPGRASWTDFLYGHHVYIVADNAKRLAIKYGEDPELAEASALLHDIADAKMDRFNPDHENETLNIGREFMRKSGFSEQEIAIAVDDAVNLHSCTDGMKPKTNVGLILATADSLAHFETDYYVRAAWQLAQDASVEKIKEWVLEKIDRDFNVKISFDDEREAVRPSYELLKNLYSR